MRFFSLAPLALTAFAATAQTVETNLFSLDVPDGWTVEASSPTMVRAFRKERADAGPSPLLTASYCFNKNAVSDPRQGVCRATCDEAALLLHRSMLIDIQLPEPRKNTHSGDITFTWDPIPTTDLVALSCSDRGRVLLILQTELD